MNDGDAAVTESERIVAWLRLPAIALIGVGESLNGSGDRRVGFYIAVGVFAAWAVALLAWVYIRPVTERLGLLIAAADIAAITAVTYLSGGGFSQARVAFALVPITLAFRFRPVLTAAAGAAVVVAYLVQSFSHPSRSRGQAAQFIALQAGLLVWLSAAAALLAWVLARRTSRMGALALQARHLLVDTLGAGERERSGLAEGLHDTALQNLLSARHDVQEAAETVDHPALRRAESTITQAVGELRVLVSELHPLVLEQTGLEAALSAAAGHASERGGFSVHVAYEARPRHPQERLLLAAARELLINVVKHAHAHRVVVRCVEDDDWITLSIADDGTGFDTLVTAHRVAGGHIGLASQRARVEAAGGRLAIDSKPGHGTVGTVRLPEHAAE